MNFYKYKIPELLERQGDMSANNLVYIEEKKRKNKYYFMVVMKDAETYVSLGLTKRFDNLRDAIKYANEIEDLEIVEYGLQIDLIREP